MNKYITAILITAGTALLAPAHAQSDIKLTLNAMNPLMYNPAYAGSYEGISVSGIYSTQFVGFQGAPVTQLLSGHTRIGDNIGAGLSLINDEAGPVKEFNFEGNFSYNVEITQDFSIAMGLKGGVNNFTIDYNLLSVKDPGEIGNSDKYSQIAPIVGVGFYAYLNNTFLGVSTPNVLTTKYYDDFDNKVAKDNLYLYSSLGHRFELDDEITLTPMAILRYTDGVDPEMVFMANLNWQEFLFGGINVQPDTSVGGFAGFRFLEMFRAGYSYDTSINRFRAYNQGVHTLFLSFDMFSDRDHNRKPFNFY